MGEWGGVGWGGGGFELSRLMQRPQFGRVDVVFGIPARFCRQQLLVVSAMVAQSRLIVVPGIRTNAALVAARVPYGRDVVAHVRVRVRVLQRQLRVRRVQRQSWRLRQGVPLAGHRHLLQNLAVAVQVAVSVSVAVAVHRLHEVGHARAQAAVVRIV